jgi:uroporphyrinogen-III synthase
VAAGERSSDRPLAGRQVALTRPEPGALAAHLVELGADVVHVPFIAIAAPPDGGVSLRRALARLAAFDWLVVTSVNGARAVGAAVAGASGPRLAAVGPATGAELAALAGRPVDLVAAVPRVEGLLAEFPAGPSRVLVAQADRAGADLAGGLRARGHDVEAVAAYSTRARVPSPDELALLDRVDAVVFASGSAVESWVAVRGTAAPPVVVAIGPVTERAARRVGVAVTHVATSPGPDGVGAVLRSAFAP